MTGGGEGPGTSFLLFLSLVNGEEGGRGERAECEVQGSSTLRRREGKGRECRICHGDSFLLFSPCRKEGREREYLSKKTTGE